MNITKIPFHPYFKELNRSRLSASLRINPLQIIIINTASKQYVHGMIVATVKAILFSNYGPE